MTSWQLAVEETQQCLHAFHSRWQHQRLLQHSLLLWRSLVLLLRQQRAEVARADAWHNQRLARLALTSWADVAAAGAAERAAAAAAAASYERRLLRRLLLQWSLVACASSAARVYYQHGLLQKVVGAWRSQAAAAAAGALQQELRQMGQHAGVPSGGSWAVNQLEQTDRPQQQAWQQGASLQPCLDSLRQQQLSPMQLLAPPVPLLPDHLLQQQRQQQPVGGFLSYRGPGDTTSSSWSPGLHTQAAIYSSPGVADRRATDAAAAAATAATVASQSMSCPGAVSGQPGWQLQGASGAAGTGSPTLPPWLLAEHGAGGLQGGSAGASPRSAGLGAIGALAGWSPGQVHPAAQEQAAGATGALTAGSRNSTSSASGCGAGCAVAVAARAVGSGLKQHAVRRSASQELAGAGSTGAGKGNPQTKRTVGSARSIGGFGNNAAGVRRKGAAAHESALKTSVGSCSPAKLTRAVVQHTQLL